MLGVIIIHVLADVIIPAAHVNDAVDAIERVALRRGVSHGPRRVERLHKILHRARDVAALRRGLHDEFLVRHAPDADAGVVAVAFDQVLPLAQIFLVAAKQAAFVHDDHAEMIAGIEQFRRGRVVRGAIGVAAEFLQLGHAEILERIRQRRADARHVLVVAGAVQLVMFAVEQESVRRIKREGADAELGFFAVKNLAVRFNCRHKFVKFGGFGRPKFGCALCHFRQNFISWRGFWQKNNFGV